MHKNHKSKIIFNLLFFVFSIFNSAIAQDGIWTQKANLGGAERAYAISFSIGTKGYIGTGRRANYTPTNDFWEYDPQNDTWTQKASIDNTERIMGVGFSIGNKGYAGLGQSTFGPSKNDFWEYNPQNNTWTQKAAYPGTGKTCAVGFSINGFGYVGTGSPSSIIGSETKEFWRYDPINNVWTRKADFGGNERDRAVGFSIASKGYIGTGYHFNGTTSVSYGDFWEYNPATDLWTQKASTPQLQRGDAEGFSTASRGYIGMGYPEKTDFFQYNPNNDSWLQVATFSGTGRIFSTSFSIGNKGYVGTGYHVTQQGTTFYNDLWEYEEQLLVPCNSVMAIGNNNQTFCLSKNPTIADLSPNTSTIKWYDSATSTNQLSATTSLVNGQTYYATNQDGNCLESIQRLAVTVTINQTPAPQTPANQTFCESDNATISNLIALGQNVKWYSSLTGTDVLLSNIILQHNTNYYATQTVNNCESTRVLTNVTINSVAGPTITSTQTFCMQQNALLSSIAITGQNIKWYDAATNGNLLSNNLSLVNDVTYYASQTINSCESKRTPILINIQNTSAPTGNGNQTFCSAQNPTISNVIVNGTNLNWYNAISSTTAIPNTTALINGATYYASQTINNCESVNRIAITITLINVLNATDYATIICDDKNDGSEIIDLTDYESNLISNPSNWTFEYYNSISGATNQINSDLIISKSNYNLKTGNHIIYVRLYLNNGCQQIVKLDLTLTDKITFPISDIVPICQTSTITVDAGSGFDSYTWSTGSTLQAISISQVGNYSVTVTKNYGSLVCPTTKNFNVVLSNAATITTIETQDWTNSENIITVNTSGLGNYEFSIDSINYQDSNIFSGLSSGIYTVYVRDKNGCGSTNEEVYLLMYPKFFTPNGDGYNDTWSIKFSYFELGLKLNIFDRYGKLLKTLDNNTAWDGKYNKTEVPSSDYWFVVTRKNGKEYRGHFALKR